MSDVTQRRRLIQEPLLQFAMLGVLIFGAEWMLGGGAPEDARQPIVVTEHLSETLAEDRYRRVGRRPEGEELAALVAGHVRDEALYREALRLGLDRGDTIIRRRLVQKMEFLLSGAAEVPPPTDEDLREYLDANANAFLAPARVAFEHVYLSRDARGDALELDAEALMAALPGEGAETAAASGDPFIAGTTFALATEQEIRERMGVEFASAVTAAVPHAWAGPFESSYGLHAVRVTERETTRARDLDEVRALVRRAFIAEARDRMAEQAVQDVVAQYPTSNSEP